MTSSIETLFSQRLRDGLSSDAPTPLYFQLFSILKGMILDGTLPFGERIPTEEQLAKAFDVSRITAKRSMDELAKEGLVERRRGKGSHVIYKYTPKPVQAPLIGMLQEIESMARNSHASVLECSLMTPPGIIRKQLGLKDSENALHLIRVREREGRKFGYYVSWTAGVEMPEDPSHFESEPRLSYFREKGLVITHVTQTLSAVSASDEIASGLGVPVGTALLTLTRRSYNTVGDTEQLHDHLTVFYNPEHFQYKMDLKID
jgi:GntR family transcriptional regulator